MIAVTNKHSKILFVSQYYFPHMGGIEQSIRKLSGFLDKRYEIQLAIPARINKNAADRLENVNILKLSAAGFWNLKYWNYSVVCLTNFPILPHFIVLVRLALMRLFRQPRPTVVLIPHGGMTVDWSQFPIAQRLVKQGYNKLVGVPLINYSASKVVAVSDWEAKSIKDLIPKKPVLVIRNGIDHINTKGMHKQNYFIFVGRIHPIKNLEGIIDAFAAIRQLPDWQTSALLIVGDYTQNEKYYERILQRVKRDRVSDSVQFLGEMSGEAKMDAIAGAQALLCLSHWESDPIVIKEAFSVKTKVIISSKYGLQDFAEEANALVWKEDLDKAFLASFLVGPFKPVFNTPLKSWSEVAQSYAEIF